MNNSQFDRRDIECRFLGQDEKLDAYITGDLSEKEMNKLEDHFLSCNSCFEEFQLREKFVSAIREMPGEKKDEYLGAVPEKKTEAIKDTVDEVSPNWIDNIRNGIKKLINGGEPKGVYPAWAFVATLFTVVLIGGASYLGISTYKNSRFWSQFEYENHVPHKYEQRILRDVSDSLKGDPMFRFFKTQSIRGISDYNAFKYMDAVHKFEKLEDTALRLQNEFSNQEFVGLLRNLYFYLGVSEFALFRSDQNSAEQNTKEFDSTAIKYLSKADSLVQLYNLEDKDRETYFLGLAYGFGGHLESAIDQLKKIGSESKFYENSKKLIKEWRN